MAERGSYRRLQAIDPSCKECVITKQALCNKCQDDTPAFNAAARALIQGNQRKASGSMQEWREANDPPIHGCGHMQGRGTA